MTNGETVRRETVRQLITELREGHHTTIDLARVVGEKGEGRSVIEVSRRALQPEQAPAKRLDRTGRRAHTFHSAPGFIDYVKRYGCAGSVVFADQPGGRMFAVLDDTRKEGNCEVVQLVPAHHPRWVPWLETLNERMEMGELVEFLRHNRRAVVSPNGRELLFTLAQVRAATSIELHSGVGNGATNGIVVTTKVTGAQSSLLELPDSITVRTPVFVDQPERDIELDLVIGASRDGSEVFGQFASADIKEAEIEAFAAIRAEVWSALAKPENGDGVVLASGAPNWNAWATY